jgi:hypothetical protein
MRNPQQQLLHPKKRLKICLLSVFTTISCALLTACSTTHDAAPEKNKDISQYNISQYEELKAAKKETEAVKYLLEISEKALGINEPNTVKLIHHYGRLLHEDGEYKQAIVVLLEAQERSKIAFGPFGGPAFQLNMDIGYAYSYNNASLSLSNRYFDMALEVLRENGQHESIKYITTLVNIAADMMRDGGLKGDYTSEFEEVGAEDDFANNNMDFVYDKSYENYFSLAEEYLLEAEEIASRLKNKDQFLESKIAIAMARFKVMETQDLAAVARGVSGGISNTDAQESYALQDDRLQNAIKTLSIDAKQNGEFINLASNARMDIAWMSKDEEHMANMCANGQVDMTEKYARGRLYEVLAGGEVHAPNVDLRVSKNIFKGLRSLNNKNKRYSNRRGKTTHFIPVCINGNLMAALVNAPSVTISDE